MRRPDKPDKPDKTDRPMITDPRTREQLARMVAGILHHEQIMEIEDTEERLFELRYWLRNMQQLAAEIEATPLPEEADREDLVLVSEDADKPRPEPASERKPEPPPEEKMRFAVFPVAELDETADKEFWTGHPRLKDWGRDRGISVRPLAELDATGDKHLFILDGGELARRDARRRARPRDQEDE